MLGGSTGIQKTVLDSGNGQQGEKRQNLMICYNVGDKTGELELEDRRECEDRLCDSLACVYNIYFKYDLSDEDTMT